MASFRLVLGFMGLSAVWFAMSSLVMLQSCQYCPSVVRVAGDYVITQSNEARLIGATIAVVEDNRGLGVVTVEWTEAGVRHRLTYDSDLRPYNQSKLPDDNGWRSDTSSGPP